MTAIEDARAALGEMEAARTVRERALGRARVEAALRTLIAEHERLTAEGSCWDEGPILRVPDGECAPPPPLCELRAGHAGAHRGGRAEWMTKEPLSTPPTDDEREAQADLDAYLAEHFTPSGRDELMQMLDAAGFRRQGPITVTTVPEMDALPARTVVMDAGGEVYRKCANGEWDCLDSNGDAPTEEASTVLWQSMNGPRATVLWEPVEAAERAR